MTILGISGSLRRDSWNGKLLRAAAEQLPEDVEFVVFDALKAVPPYDEDDDVEPVADGARVLRDAIAAADGVLFATPEYNASVPGQLKNAIDWASRPRGHAVLKNKPAAVIGASTGVFGAVWAQAELRKVLATAGARVVEGEAAVGQAPTKFDGDDNLVDDQVRDQVAEVVHELVAAVEVRRTAVAA